MLIGQNRLCRFLNGTDFKARWPVPGVGRFFSGDKKTRRLQSPVVAHRGTRSKLSSLVREKLERLNWKTGRRKGRPSPRPPPADAGAGESPTSLKGCSEFLINAPNNSRRCLKLNSGWFLFHSFSFFVHCSGAFNVDASSPLDKTVAFGKSGRKPRMSGRETTQLRGFCPTRWGSSLVEAHSWREMRKLERADRFWSDVISFELIIGCLTWLSPREISAFAMNRVLLFLWDEIKKWWRKREKKKTGKIPSL